MICAYANNKTIKIDKNIINLSPRISCFEGSEKAGGNGIYKNMQTYTMQKYEFFPEWYSI